MMKKSGGKNFFLRFLTLLLTIGWSTSAVMAAPSYFCVEIIPVLENGANGLVFACDNASANSKYNNYYYNIGKEGLWTTHFDATIERLSGGKPNFYIMAQPGDQRTMFDGWYWDAACTERLESSASGINTFAKVTISGNGRTLTSYPSAAAAEAGTKIIIYAKFVKITPDFDWSSKAATPADDGKYCIYSPVMHRFLKAPKGSASSSNKPVTTDNPADATLFTCDITGTGTKNTYCDNYGVIENRSYKICSFAYDDNGTTKYAKADSYSWGTSKTNIYVWSWVSLLENSFFLTKADATGSDFTYSLEIYLNGDLDYPLSSALKRNGGIYWMFIPKDAFDEVAQVNSLNENGAVTITESPNASGTANVTFNVAAGSVPSAFNYELSGADASYWALGTPTCSGGILSVPVTYTAKNRHSGTSNTDSEVTVTVTAKNAGASIASGTASAYVDFEPRFALTVDALDWSRVGEEIVETFYSGQEIAASERDRLANKLVYAPAQTTGVAANHATWTATIIGANANQFKFANGTQTVSGPYSANLLDVHYAPTTTGNHTAILHIVTTYTDAASHTETYEKDITLRGVGSAASRITFAKAGNQLPTNAESYDFGEIIGTNHKDITADLFISQITNPQMVWSDPAGQFEFDESTVDLSQLNQTLTFRAHRTSPVTENTVHTATLTISGKGTNNDDVSATLTLTYTALPLIPTTVTWNWATINENATVNNPITTNSDGVWTLSKSAGDAITYDKTAKTATAAYLHHEPGKTAEFVLQIPQTDTYTAFGAEYETSILAPAPEDVFIDSQEKFNNYVSYKSSTNASYIYFTEGNNTVYMWAETIGFSINGQRTFSFIPTKYQSYSSISWTITEYTNGVPTKTVLNAQALTFDEPYEFSITPGVTEIRLYNSSKALYKDIHFYEYDIIEADKEQVALIYDNGAISSMDINATFANKRQVTASLNATAAQYFEIRSTGKTTGSSMVFNDNDGFGVGKVQSKTFTIALKAGANAAAARAAATGNACQLIFSDDYTYNHEELVLPIVVIEPCEITYKYSANGSYTVTYQKDGEAHAVSSANYDKTINTTDPADYVVTLSAPDPISDYQFQGWRIDGSVVSYKSTLTTSIGKNCAVEAIFVPIEVQNFRVGDTYFAELGAALSAANTSADSKVVTLMQDVTLGDGNTPVDYTIPAGVTLLIPHKADFYSLQETPDVVQLAGQSVLAAYRTLTLKEGVNLICNGNICVAGKLLSANGGNKSAYTTGECGVINAANGGHIELNDGANLYCWGYIKGQDMDQGNNTQNVGSVIANSGATIWENFELGDWRGGSASLDIYNNNVIDHRKLFPFQSYAIQNVEVPTTFKYGSTLRTYTSITTGMGDHAAVFSMIGSRETMFKLEDANSVVRTWYDPTTDLTCYALSGTAKLDALHVSVYVDMSSEDFILPVSNSMHIILEDDLNLVNPLMAQAGSVIEIKPTATVNLSSELYLYDKDQWGKYIHNYYFRSFNNLTSHKDRGAENSKAGLDDAKLIVDGTLNINGGGKIYSTAGGANMMGNGGGVINFNTVLPSADLLWAVEVKGELPYITWVNNPIAAANLCNEDGSYTRSVGNATFYNNHGRWFHEEDKDEQEDHTYWFTYMNNGNSGEDVGTAAVYSHDKTGLEARQKWFNVEEDASCANWWTGTTPAALYNYTLLNEWHQFIATEDAGVYSGSNNALYRKEGCEMVETGAVDENCLYTFTDGKKALVDGQFIPLTSNGYDPAYHKSDASSQYYICFAGCNWHPATPYTGESKAYTITPEAGVTLHYIWFNNDWMNVLRDEPFFYTEDEQTNVRTYYEYVNGEWEIATPYVSVTDAAETRAFYRIKEAFNVASIKKDATITILRDLPNVSEVLTYSTQNTTCTLDLNGHLLGGNIANLVTVNAPGATFTITDNTALKIGKISSTANNVVYVQKGTLVVTNCTIETTAATAVEGAASTTITINGGYFAANTKCVQAAGSRSISGGHFTKNANLAAYAAAHKYPFETTDPKYKWEISDAWTITFKNGETTLQTLHLKPGEMPVYTANQPTKADNKFIGWTPAIVAATADVIYQAQFEPTSASESRITLNSNGGNEGLQYVYVTTNATIGTVPAGTTKDGHTFVGWFTDASNGTQITTATTVSADVTWYAHYTKNSYTLTWNANGGQLSGSYTSGSVQYGAAVTAPTATLSGHTFLGWNVTPATTMPAQDVTYTAQWSIAAKHYLQNIDGTYPATPEATDNVSGGVGEYVTPAVKTYDGFITPTTQTVQIGQTTEVTYQYARRIYTITLDATTNGGTCATASLNVKHGATPTLPVASKAGQILDGWFTKAVGGDQITNETLILRNIGTLYAHYVDAPVVEVDLVVSATQTLDVSTTVGTTTITTNGALTIPNGLTLTTGDLILEATQSASGQVFTADNNITVTGNAYFDMTLNAQTRTWYGVGVPWRVNAQYGIYGGADSKHLTLLRLGKDFDIIWYDGEIRAASGPVSMCYKYLEDIGDPNNRIVEPGRMYFMFFARPYNVIRFKKLTGAALVNEGNVTTERYSGAADQTNHGWNGIANPGLTHVTIPGATPNAGYRYNSVNIDNKSLTQWVPVLDLQAETFVVGQPIMVQLPQTGGINLGMVRTAASSAPLRKMAANGDIDRAEVVMTSSTGLTDRILCAVDDEARDEYTIGSDLVKFTNSDELPQLWINNYKHALAINTVRLENSVATYPLTIVSPKAGEYKLSLANKMADGIHVYLTLNGEAIADLTEGEYVLTLGKETSKAYGIRLVRGPRGTVTAIDEALEGKENVEKVVKDGVLYIIRQGNVYDASGRKVE